MKKLFLMGFVALAFASCVSDKEVTVQTQEEKYEKAFEQLIGGQIGANVNWGFNAMKTASFNEEGKFTGMRAAYVNNNQWGMYLVVPEEMTPEQKAKVEKYFTEVKQPQGIAVNWSDFFVHQVSRTDKGPYMNYLYCGEKDYVAKDHVNNFNGGSATEKKNVGVAPKNDGSQNCFEVDYYDGIMLMQDSGTEFFAFHNSFDSQYYEDNYVMVTGEMIDAAYPEEPSVAGMYFVGFDFEANGQSDNQKIARDYYFNDWVIRVSPGFYRNSNRVFVEDLIASDLSQIGYSDGKSDWDFNDAVFDVAYSQNNNKQIAIITLWAAGGTKALTVGGKEVHELFAKTDKRVTMSTMINTNANGGVNGLQPVIFRVDMGTIDWNKTYTANDVKVYVGSTELKAETGKAPQKVVVSNTTRWMQELLLITKGYAKFAEYATSNNGTPANWYETVTDASVLY